MVKVAEGSRWAVVDGPFWNENRQRYYRCRCACGKEKNVFAYNLTTGISMSCGCLRRDKLLKKSRYETEEVSADD